MAKRHAVAVDTETRDDAVGSCRYIGVVAKDFPLVDVGNMDLDHERLIGVQRIEDGNRRVTESAGLMTMPAALPRAS